MGAAHFIVHFIDMHFIDSHCHFDFRDFDADRSQLWQDCMDAGIRNLIIPGVCPEQWPHLRHLCQTNAGWYYSVGLHPHWLEQTTSAPTDLNTALTEASQDERCIAIGECGLDKSIATPLEQQELFLQCQLDVAEATSLPILLHCHKAHNELLRLLKARKNLRGIVHGFSGSIELAQQFIALGFLIGVGGTITYARANKTRNTVAGLPLNCLVLETDAPDMPIAGQQGRRNSPLRIVDIANVLAQLRQQSLYEIAQQTTLNVHNMFNLKALT